MQLSKYPKNLEEMKIARYFFQLLFNCSFDNFRIHQAIINPQMIELLFVNEIARNVPLQIHSQETWLLLYDDHLLNFLANHLVTNHFYVEFDDRFDEEENVDILFKILAIGGIKSSRITFLHLSSKLYNCIIENIAASQDIFKMPNEIGFNGIWGPLISSERATNVEVTTVEDELKCTKFQLVNKYNPKMVFSVSIEECYTDIHVAGQENKEIGVIAEIKKIE
ncbi:unnamed protein product [Meloidogyne enterolobii]|uniref:Uncharacterized protein n=1 Tax=Meloidogyne enterolobii TaxID=390850 RepID=A0ACB0ZYH7_MELEN